MYTQHPLFQPPPDPQAPLWRYMELAKFLSILENESLFFARADTMTDKLEGSMSEANAALRPLLYGEYYARMAPGLNYIFERLPRFTYLNCWHASEYESAAMWGLYQAAGKGIAIRSTFEKLCKSLMGERATYIGRVDYVDYSKEFIRENDIRAHFLYKSRSFEHEREVRAVIQDIPAAESLPSTDQNALNLEAQGPLGLNVPVDVARLVEQVYVAPEAPNWFAQLVQKLVRRYGHDWEVLHSELGRDPIY